MHAEIMLMLASLNRSSYWWDHIVLKTFTPVDWMENFRVSRETFHYLCQKLGPVIQRKNTQLRNAIPVNKRLAITLWCLATCSEYRTIAHLFGVARCTVCVIVHDTCKAIVSRLQKIFIKFPCGEDLKTAAEGFKSKTGMIQCVGSIDGCHIPITPPALNHTDYYNRKGWYSVVLQAVVDSSYLFRDVCVGWPGSVHDARVFANSGIFTKLTSEKILDCNYVRIQDKNISLFLIGDSAYPLKTFLMKPFAFNTALTNQQKVFNYNLSKARIVVENAFGRLKARWRRLTKRNDMNVSNVPHIVTACCILHNVCELFGDEIPDGWMNELSADLLEQPSTISPGATERPESDAKVVRDVLVNYYNN